MIGKVFFKGNDIIVLPKERTTEIVLDLPDQGRGDIVLQSEVVRHFVNSSLYHFLMHSYICRTSTDCQDHPSDQWCLFLGRPS